MSNCKCVSLFGNTKNRDAQTHDECAYRIVNTISDYMDQEVDYAYMLDGIWGSGKTFFANHTLKNELKIKGKDILHISLFGKSTIHEITREMLNFFMFHQNADETSVVKNIINNINSSDKEKNKSRLGKLVVNITSELMDYEFQKRLLQNKSKYLFVFDDVERCNDDYLNDILGEINSSFIQKGYHVLFIADETQFNENSCYKTLKEKLVRITIRFKYDSFGSQIEDIVTSRNDEVHSLYDMNQSKFMGFVDSVKAVENLRTWFTVFDYYNLVINKCHFDNSYPFYMQLFAIIFITTHYMKTNPKLFDSSLISIDSNNQSLEKTINKDFGISCFSVIGYGRDYRLSSQSPEMIMFGRMQSIIDLTKSGYVDCKKIIEEMELFFPQGTKAEVARVKTYSIEKLSQEELATCLRDILAGVENNEFEINKLISISRDFEYYDKLGYLSLYGDEFRNYKSLLINSIQTINKEKIGEFFKDDVLLGYPYGDYLSNPNFLASSLDVLSKQYDYDKANRDSFIEVFSNIGDYEYTSIPFEVKNQMIEKVERYDLFNMFLQFDCKDIYQIILYLFDISKSVNSGDVYYSEIEPLKKLLSFINSVRDSLNNNKQRIEILHLADEIDKTIRKLENTRGKL